MSYGTIGAVRPTGQSSRRSRAPNVVEPKGQPARHQLSSHPRRRFTRPHPLLLSPHPCQRRPAMHRLARLPRVVQALHGPRYRYGVQPFVRTLATAAAPSPNDPFANGTNTYYVEEMYRLWRQDPKSVHASWDVYFSGMDKGLPSFKAFQPPPTIAPADGAPALHAHGGAELDDHLKVCVCALKDMRRELITVTHC